MTMDDVCLMEVCLHYVLNPSFRMHLLLLQALFLSHSIWLVQHHAVDLKADQFHVFPHLEQYENR